MEKTNKGMWEHIKEKDMIPHDSEKAIKDAMDPWIEVSHTLTIEKLREFIMDIFVNRVKPERTLKGYIYCKDEEEYKEVMEKHHSMILAFIEGEKKEKETLKALLLDNNNKWLEKRLKKRKYVKKALEAALRLDREKNKPII